MLFLWNIPYLAQDDKRALSMKDRVHYYRHDRRN